jgi:DNA-binding response OmpR family regulator
MRYSIMSQRTILVIDDDKKTVDLIRLYLQRERYRVVEAYNGQDGLALARETEPTLVVLDWMLPVLDGLDVCRILRAESMVPIIMLTARAAEEDKLRGLDLGADDYLTKPFSPRELVARVRVILRRMHQHEETVLPPLQLGELRVDFVAHEAWSGGESIRLTPKEFKLLETFAREPGRAFSRTDLLNLVFGPSYDGFERTVDVHMMNLRKKIEPHPEQPRYLETVYGVGYKLRRDHDSA